MSTTAGGASSDLRCTVQTAELGESAHGTAGSAQRYLLVELPLPWSKPIASHPLLSFLADTPTMTDQYRLLAIHGADTEPGQHRVITYERNLGPSLTYTGSQVTVPTAQLAATVLPRLAGDTGEIAGEPLGADVIDVAICTQGTHDRCCGLFGTELYLAAIDQPQSRVRYWRTSHTGGHRFAPTAAIFPTARMWAGLTVDRLNGILSGELDHTEAAPLLRGSMGLDSRQAQIADAAAFGQFGWEWLDGPREIVSLESEPGTDTEVVLTAAEPKRTITVAMTKGTTIPVPKCGQPLDAATKATETFEVVSLRAETAASD